jgi:serine protease inhibitor
MKIRHVFPAMTLMALAACNGVAAIGPSPQMAEVDPQVFRGYNDFGFDVFHALAAEAPDSNIVLSPSSLAFALAMTYVGAEGATAREMADVLGVGGVGDAAFDASNRGWLDALGDAGDIELSIANSIWIRDIFQVEPAFVERNETVFEAVVARRPFDQATVDEVNRWVAERTNERIEEIIQEFDPLDRVLLLNAVHFLGEWTTPFQEGGTSPGSFVRPDGSRVPIPMMTRRDTISYHAGDGFEAVRLPYGEDERWGMLLLLPDRDSDLAALYRDLGVARLGDVASRLEPTDIEIELPRFTVEWEETLNETLIGLGMGSAFDPARSDFSGINPQADDLHVSFVKQKTFLQVNEKGTEAAAVTAVMVSLTSAPMHPVVVFDRPFFFAIHDRETDTILFLGQITDPEDPEWDAG